MDMNNENKEELYKTQRQTASQRVKDHNEPLAPRTKALFDVFTNGAKEFYEGGRREYNSKHKKSQDTSRDADHTFQEDSTAKTMEEAEKERRLAEKRKQQWEEARDRQGTLTDRTKAGTAAIFTGTKELFTGGKRQLNNRKKHNATQNETVNSDKKEPPINPDDVSSSSAHENLSQASEPEQKEDNNTDDDTSRDVDLANEAEEYRASTLHIGKDQVMHDFHKDREHKFQQQRKEKLATATDRELPLTERLKAGGSAVLSATKELSEGTRREMRSRKTEQQRK